VLDCASDGESPNGTMPLSHFERLSYYKGTNERCAENGGARIVVILPGQLLGPAAAAETALVEGGMAGALCVDAVSFFWVCVFFWVCLQTSNFACASV
jgi:hypothetical protein